MKLLDFDQNAWRVQLNKPWLLTVPEFVFLIERDKGDKTVRNGKQHPSPGDYRGQFKLNATEEISYIYMMLDWNSPLRNRDIDDKIAESLRVFHRVPRTQEEVEKDEPLMAAYSRYSEYLYKQSRALRTLDTIKASLKEVDNYFETIKFTAVDKQGKLLHSMTAYLDNIDKVRKAYAAIEEFEDKVNSDLINASSIAGKTRELGIKEREFAFENKKREWSEASPLALTEDDEKVLKQRAKDAGNYDDDDDLDEPFTEEEKDV